MNAFLEALKNRASQNPKRLVFAEGTEPKVLNAAKKLKELGFPEPILVTDPKTHSLFEQAAQAYADLRGTSIEDARTASENLHVFATLLLHLGQADGMIAGPTAPSKERILPALQIIKTIQEGHRASSLFFMILPEDTNPDAANGGVLLFADCALNVDPDLNTLVQIAIDSHDSAKQFGLDPKVAMLSFSTAGSSDDPHALLMRQATELVRIQRPDIAIEGEVQADAALMDQIGKAKDPNSPIAGQANVLIFPDLESGNIAYKLVERLAGAQAIGPILQGLRKPVNEVSRGASSEDLFWVALATSIQAQKTT